METQSGSWQGIDVNHKGHLRSIINVRSIYNSGAGFRKPTRDNDRARLPVPSLTLKKKRKKVAAMPIEIFWTEPMAGPPLPNAYLVKRKLR